MLIGKWRHPAVASGPRPRSFRRHAAAANPGPRKAQCPCRDRGYPGTGSRVRTGVLNTYYRGKHIERKHKIATTSFVVVFICLHQKIEEMARSAADFLYFSLFFDDFRNN